MRSTSRSVVAVVSILVMSLGMGAIVRAQDATPAATGHLVVTEQRTIEIPGARVVSMSPDGRLIVAAKPLGGYQHGQLCVYDVETVAERACADLSGLDSGLRIEDIAWSPDGSHLAFAELGFVYLRDGDLWLMDTSTGALTNIDDDGFTGKLSILSDEPSHDTISLPVNPTFSPDGQSVAFSRSVISNGTWTGNDISVVSINGGKPRTLTRVTLDTPGVVNYGIRWAPDASRLYYSVHYPDTGNARNGIWVVNPDGLNQRHILGTTDPDAGAPAVIGVSANGATLLAYYPLAAIQVRTIMMPIFALVDVKTGAVTPLLVPEADAVYQNMVILAALSPDGTKVLTVARMPDERAQVWVSDIDGGNVVRLGEPIAKAGWIGLGIMPTWATDGSVLITGGGALSTATLLRIPGSAAAAPVTTILPESPTAATPAAIGAIAPGATATVNDDGVQLRAAPSRDAMAVLEMDRGTDVIVLGPAEEADGFVWWPVEDVKTRTIGWVRAEFLSPTA